MSEEERVTPQQRLYLEAVTVFGPALERLACGYVGGGQSRRYFLPFVPGVALALTSGILKAPSTARMFWLPVVGIGLFAAMSWWNAWTARRLRREIERIDVL